jgi:protoporphyrinogen oxidase
LALRLAQKGHSVSLFEANKDFGGLAGSWEMNGYHWDRFYHVILMSDSYTRALLKELDMEKEISWVETKTGFYSDGNLYSMSNTLEFLKFPPLNLIDKFRLGATIFYASKVKDWKKLENISVSDWLTKLSGTNTFEKIWLPLLKAKLGENYKQTSATFIWATIQRMYAARRSGLKKEVFGCVNGGYGIVIDRFKELLEKNNVTLKSNYVAENIENKNGREVNIDFNNGKAEQFDKVILTIPSTFAERICNGLTEKERSAHKNIKYLGVVCASLLLDQPLSRYYVTNITDSWVPFTGVIEMTTIVDPSYFGNNSLVYLPKYVVPNDPIFEENDETLKEYFWSALKRMYPHLKDKNLKFFEVSKAKNVFSLPVLNYSKKLPSIETSIKGVYILNSAHILNGTLNINESVQLAETKLNQIIS